MKLFKIWSLWFFPMYEFLSSPFHCSFKAFGGFSAAKPYLISRKSIPFHTNRLTLTTAIGVNAIPLGILHSYISSCLYHNKIRDKMKLWCDLKK